MLGAAEADPLRSELDGFCRVVRGVGVGAHLQAAGFVRPREKLGELCEELCLRGRDHAEQHCPGRTIDRQQLALADAHAVDREAA